MSQGKYKIESDGTMYVKKKMAATYHGFDTLTPEQEAWFPCMDIDGDSFFIRTLLGGWFGLHKFMTGHYLQGIIYTLTFGVFGISYLFDLLYIITGYYTDDRYTYEGRVGTTITRHKHRRYSRPVSNRMYSVIALVIAGIITYMAVRYGYLILMSRLFVVFNLAGNSGGI